MVADLPADGVSPAAISVRDLVVRRGDFELTAPQWDAKAGAIIGLVGANGAGKTTFMSVIAGHMKLGTGTVQVLGLPIGDFGWRLPEVLGFVPDTLNALESLPLAASTSRRRSESPPFRTAHERKRRSSSRRRPSH